MNIYEYNQAEFDDRPPVLTDWEKSDIKYSREYQEKKRREADERYFAEHGTHDRKW